MTWGHEASVGYFSQDHKESIRPGVTLLEWLHEFDSERFAAGTARRARPDAFSAAKTRSRRPRRSPEAKPPASFSAA